jgi:AcrR family transcriptional regulator
MKVAKHTSRPRYRSPLRAAQAVQTRERIGQAAAALLQEGGSPESVTFRAVAERAQVTEMTVYRHFPSRDELLQGLWQHLNARMDPSIGMPASVTQLLGQHGALLEGFDRIAPEIIASLCTPQGREMRAALNDRRRRAFRAIAQEAGPGLGADARTRAAAILQLLHSAHAWMSLREQWGFDGRQAAAATRWAIEILLDHLRKKP